MGTDSAQRNSMVDHVSFIPSSNTRQCADIKEGTNLAGKVHKTPQSKKPNRLAVSPVTDI